MTNISKQRNQVARAIFAQGRAIDFGNAVMPQEWIDRFRAKLDTLTDSSVSIVLPPIDLVLAAPDLTLAQRMSDVMARVYR